VHDFSISLDGYAAGPRQSVKAPLGVGGEQLHEWGRTVVVPVLLRSGERLFEGLGDALDGWVTMDFTSSRSVSHVRLRRAPADFDTMEA
jgi:hypothetical protein